MPTPVVIPSEVSPRLRRLAAVLFVAAAGGCAPAVLPVGSPAPEPLTAEEVRTLADLLAIEDRREYDISTIGRAVTAGRPEVRAHAALTIARLQDQAGRSLIRILLADEDSSVAATAAFAAGQLSDTAAVDLLRGIITDAVGRRARPTVAAEAARALGRIGTQPAKDAVLGFLAEADTADLALRPVVREALVVLTPVGEPLTAPFDRWTTSPDPKIRWRAAYALTRRPRPEAVTAARRLLSDTDPLARSFALRGLAGPVVDAAGAPRAEILDQIVALSGDEAYPVRIEAIRALGTYTEARSVERLRTLLESERPHDVIAALESLGSLGRSAIAVTGAIRAIADDSSLASHVRGVALVSLAAIDADVAAPLIARFAGGVDWRLRAATADALVGGGEASLSSLRALARDPDPRVAAAAVRASLEAVDSASLDLVQPLLLELLASPDAYVRAAALEGLGAVAAPSTFPALLDAYARAASDVEPDAALAAIDAIANVGDTGALQPERAFFARFSRPESHLARLRAVARFGDAARTAWGEPLPIALPADPDRYRQLVEDWMTSERDTARLPGVRIETEAGAIELELFADVAPLTVSNFLTLAAAEYFDGQEWPRVVPNFVVQGGDPRGDTSGGPGYTIRDELNRVRFETGTVGMALAGPDTGGSQFFIDHSPQPHLDGTYTVFGRVVAGQEVLEDLLPGDRVLSIREIEDLP